MASIRCSCPNALGYPRNLKRSLHVPLFSATALYTAVCARLCASHASTFPSLSRHFASTPAPVLRTRQLCVSARQPYTSASQPYTSTSQLYTNTN